MGRALLEPLALFLSPFAVFAIYLVLRAALPARGRALDARTRVDPDAHRPGGGGARPRRAQRARAARPGRLRSRACRERRARSRADRMTAFRASRAEGSRTWRRCGRARWRARSRRSTARARRPGSSAARCAIWRSAQPVARFRPRDHGATDEVIRRAEAAGFKVAPTGVAHGTVTLVVDGRPIETTTLREDVETDGRRAKVAFGRDFAADARRRDFTINALSLGAGRDCPRLLSAASTISPRAACASSATPRQRIREDYLRILRFFRLSARYARGALDADGFRPRSGRATASPAFRGSACAPNC